MIVLIMKTLDHYSVVIYSFILSYINYFLVALPKLLMLVAFIAAIFKLYADITNYHRRKKADGVQLSILAAELEIKKQEIAESVKRALLEEKNVTV